MLTSALTASSKYQSNSDYDIQKLQYFLFLVLYNAFFILSINATLTSLLRTKKTLDGLVISVHSLDNPH